MRESRLGSVTDVLAFACKQQEEAELTQCILEGMAGLPEELAAIPGLGYVCDS